MKDSDLPKPEGARWCEYSDPSSRYDKSILGYWLAWSSEVTTSGAMFPVAIVQNKNDWRGLYSSSKQVQVCVTGDN